MFLKKSAWNANRNWYVIYGMVPFPITLSDPNLDFKWTIFFSVI